MQCPNRNNFCYVCGLFAPSSHMRNITKNIVTAFEAYFVVTYIPNLWYVPEVVCDYCYRCLHGGQNKTHKIKYVAPIIWLRRTEHAPDLCYFCVTNLRTSGFRYSIREKIDYADVESVIPARVSSTKHPTAPSEDISEDEQSSTSPVSSNMFELESEFVATSSELGYKVPHFVTQADFNDLVRDANISKATAEIVASRLKQWNLVADDLKITSARKRDNTIQFDKYFALHEDSEKNLAYCDDVNALFKEIGHPHVPQEWRLFIDSSVISLKVVLLHIGNKYPSVPIAYATNMPENYDNMKLILELINYRQHEWRICCDLKVVGLLTGVKKGYSKHQCFLCVWEGRKTDLHYTNFIWNSRINFQLGQLSIDHVPLVDSRKIILPPLHIKLGLIRNFVRALDSTSKAFQLLHTIFPKLTSAKIEAGVFNGPDISKLIKNKDFHKLLNAVERRAWDGLIAVIENFLGNKKADNYKEIVAEMISAFHEMKVNMSLKIHFLHNHLDFFPPNLGEFSDEHGERFHQDIATIEKRFKGKDIRHMLGEYCWSIVRDTKSESYKRQTKRPRFNLSMKKCENISHENI